MGNKLNILIGVPGRKSFTQMVTLAAAVLMLGACAKDYSNPPQEPDITAGETATQGDYIIIKNPKVKKYPLVNVHAETSARFICASFVKTANPMVAGFSFVEKPTEELGMAYEPGSGDMPTKLVFYTSKIFIAEIACAR